MLAASFAVGGIPFSGIAARALVGVDLRRRGSGTVSGSGLYEVAGFAPMAVAGSLEVAAGALGPILAGRDRKALGALAASMAIVGHNWSPLLSGAGGRGISTVLGATLVLAPEGTVLVGAGLGAGKFAHQTGLGCLLGLFALFPVLARRRGKLGVLIAACLTAPVLAKRVLGNQAPKGGRTFRAVLTRVLFDSDPGFETPDLLAAST